MVRELQVKDDRPQGPSWEKKVALWHEMVYEDVPLPSDFKNLLADEYAHLVPVEGRPDENKRAWEAYLAWAGDITEDERTPGQRLEAYFAEQEVALANL